MAAPMKRLLLIGNPEPIHVGAHLYGAAEQMGLPVALCDTRAAYTGAWLAQKWHWWMRGHRPPRLQDFQAQVIKTCERFEPTHLIATGIAPLAPETLAWLHARHILTLNYLTDDPWNPTHYADWFMAALPAYDWVLTPRRANRNDLGGLGCANVEFLPFAYNPVVHFPAVGAPEQGLTCDVVFAGGADADRVPFLGALIAAGLNVHLYGGYWERYKETRKQARGHADMDLVRRAVKNARICLNLVRRANRDDHVMRSFEIPAMRGCLLTEDTETHRALYGAEGDAVLYFQTPAEMVDKARQLLVQPMEREGLSRNAHERILTGEHTYQDRLGTMLAFTDGARV